MPKRSSPSANGMAMTIPTNIVNLRPEYSITITNATTYVPRPPIPFVKNEKIRYNVQIINYYEKYIMILSMA